MNSLITRKTFIKSNHFPEPGSDAERTLFNDIQQVMKSNTSRCSLTNLLSETVVIIPSLTLDMEILSKIKGALHYEERMLCLLMLLRMPLTKVIYVTSVPVPEVIIDYYLNLLPGITGPPRKKRLTMLSCYDSSVKPLTQNS